MFFSIIFCLIITYLFFRFKSKIFEIFVFLLNILNICSIYLMCTALDTKDRNFSSEVNVTFLLGERISTIYPQILFGTFYLGFNIGVCYFYFVDITKNPINYTHLNEARINISNEDINFTIKNSYDNSGMPITTSNNHNGNLDEKTEELECELMNIKSSFINSSRLSENSDDQIREDLKKSNIEQVSTKVNVNSKETKFNTQFNFTITNEEESNDLAFYYNFKFMVQCTYINGCSWIFIRILCLIVIIALCIFYNLNVLLIGKLAFELKESFYVLYVYEKKIFLIFFIILILSVIFKKTNFEYDMNRNYSYIAERMSFSYYLILESFVILIVSFTSNNLRINIFNVILISIGSAIFTLAFSIYFSLLFELPLRHLFKDMLRPKKENVNQSIMLHE